MYRNKSEAAYEYSYDYQFKPIKLKQGFTNASVNLEVSSATKNINFQTFDANFQESTYVADDVITFEKLLPDMIAFTHERPFARTIKPSTKRPVWGFFILVFLLFARLHIKTIKSSAHLKPIDILFYVLVGLLVVPFISTIINMIYQALAYAIIDAEQMDNRSTFFGFVAFMLLFLIIAPFYSAFIYYNYYENRGREASR